MLATVAAAFGTGLALAGAPGPVQAVIVTEAAGGGVKRGLLALAGASGTFAALLVLLALGVATTPPKSMAGHALGVAGGGVLLWMAWTSRRTAFTTASTDADPHSRPAVRGALAVAVNPGAWLFLGAVAAPLLSTAEAHGTPGAASVVAALVAGAALGDVILVLASGIGLRLLSRRVRVWVGRGLSMLLAALGLWLLVDGLVGLLLG